MSEQPDVEDGMRWIAAALMLGWTVPALAACHTRTMGETPASLVHAIAGRLKSAGIASIEFGGREDGGTIYLLTGSKVALHLKVDDGLVDEVGTDVAIPTSRRDLDQAMTLAAFTVARFSGENEVRVKDALYTGLSDHRDPGSWVTRWGVTGAVVTKTGDGSIVVKIGKLDCNG